MTLWGHSHNFSSDFLERHHPFVLQDAYHRVVSFLLYPCGCETKKNKGLPCSCKTSREKVAFALNSHLYNNALKEKRDSETLRAMRCLWGLPDDSEYRFIAEENFPLWYIREEFGKRMEPFIMVDQMVRTLLRLGASHKSFFNKPQASLNEAIERIVGNKPLYSKVRCVENWGGEKAYAAHFKEYSPVCHFITALEWVGDCIRFNEDILASNTSSYIESFLTHAHWFRERLLELERPNVKENQFISPNSLISLPSWVKSHDLDLNIPTFEDKIQRMKENLMSIDPKKKKAERD